jgi:hypothetical protein
LLEREEAGWDGVTVGAAVSEAPVLGVRAFHGIAACLAG